MGNDRALIKGEIYSNNGLHIATIVQERLWITGVLNYRGGYDFMGWCNSQASGLGFDIGKKTIDQ